MFLLRNTRRYSANIPSMRAASNFPQNVFFSVLRHTRRRSAGGGLFCAASLLSSSPATSPSLPSYPLLQVYYFSTCPSSAWTYFEQLVDGQPMESRRSFDWRWRHKFHFSGSFESTKREHFSLAPTGKKLEDLPQQWRPSRLNWLRKALPGTKHDTFIRILDAQRGWLTQEYASCVIRRFLQNAEFSTAFRVYKWTKMQHWYQFDFDLASTTADALGKESDIRKSLEVYEDILDHGRVPDVPTFHVVTASCLLQVSYPFMAEKALDLYRRLIQLEGYKPHPRLHNSLFEVLVYTKKLEQAEFVYQNMQAFGLEIHKDIFGGLIWLHNHQDSIDKDRIASLREEMCSRGIEEGTDVLESVLRASSKNGDVDEAERAWKKLLSTSDSSPSPEAFVFRLSAYEKTGDHVKALEIFRGMQEDSLPIPPTAYLKILEILCKAQKQEEAESMVNEFRKIGSRVIPLQAYIFMMVMYLVSGSHDKLESTFLQCLKKSIPDCKVLRLYLQSLVEKGDIKKAGEVFDRMDKKRFPLTDAHCCNIILRGYLSHGEHKKAEKVIEIMRRRKYDIDSSLTEKLSSACGN